MADLLALRSQMLALYDELAAARESLLQMRADVLALDLPEHEARAALRKIWDDVATLEQQARECQEVFSNAIHAALPPRPKKGAWVVCLRSDGQAEWRPRPPEPTTARLYGLPERASDQTAYEFVFATLDGRNTTEIRARAAAEDREAAAREYWERVKHLKPPSQKKTDDEITAIWTRTPHLKRAAGELDITVKQLSTRLDTLGLRKKRSYRKP